MNAVQSDWRTLTGSIETSKASQARSVVTFAMAWSVKASTAAILLSEPASRH
jgi:hypothetical protein